MWTPLPLAASKGGRDLLDRRRLLVLDPALCLRRCRRHVEHETTVGLELVGRLRGEHGHRGAQSVDGALHDLLRRRDEAEARAVRSRELADELACALAMRRELLRDGARLTEAVREV